MYLGESDGQKLYIAGSVRAAAVISVLATILIGICPEQLANLTNLAASTFMR